MDLVTLVTACALAVDPKLMHALVWHQSGGEPWAVSVQGERSPRVYAGMDDAIREARASPIGSVVRVGLAGLSVPPSKVAASVLLPCRNVAMAAVQIANTPAAAKRIRLKTDPTFCAVAVYRGSWGSRTQFRDRRCDIRGKATPQFRHATGLSTEFSIQRPIRRPTQPPSSPLPTANERVRVVSVPFPSGSIGWRADRGSTPVRYLQSDHLCRMPAAPPAKQCGTVTCLCAAQAWAFHDGAS
jgi:hypothetical protein